MTSIQAKQDLISLKSGIWGLNKSPDELKALVSDGFISKEGAQLFLKEEFNSDAEIVINNNQVNDNLKTTTA